jgi:acetyl esterase/lipase
MAEDVERAIAWVIQNIELYGGNPSLSRLPFAMPEVVTSVSVAAGDPENVTVVGQSAGAHLSSFVLVRKATEELEAKLRGESEAQRRKSEAESRGDDEVKPMRERREVNAEEIENGTGKAKWSTKQIKKFIGVSGPYDLAGYVGYVDTSQESMHTELVLNSYVVFSLLGTCTAAAFPTICSTPSSKASFRGTRLTLLALSSP